jgi:hypothetical protein
MIKIATIRAPSGLDWSATSISSTSTLPVRLCDSEIVSGGTARGRRHTPRVARSGARLTRPFGIKSPAMLPR